MAHRESDRKFTSAAIALQLALYLYDAEEPTVVVLVAQEDAVSLPGDRSPYKEVADATGWFADIAQFRARWFELVDGSCRNQLESVVVASLSFA